MTTGSRPHYTVIDETHSFPKSFWERFFAAGVKETPVTKVRIRFNRPFTWSERETFRDFVITERLMKHHFNHDDPSELFITTHQDSRAIVKKVQQFVATEYLNIHPKAVKTITPKLEV